jgi:hypothetical protein
LDTTHKTNPALANIISPLKGSFGNEHVVVPTLLVAAAAAFYDELPVARVAATPGRSSSPLKPLANPAVIPQRDKPEAVQWKSLFAQSGRFLVIENGWRYVSEEATRHPHRPFFKGYVDSVTNVHGWADGNPFLDNYIGHPMQGSVSGFIWTQNDLRYRNVAFGKDPDYWKSRLRAAAFAWAYSTLAEIGPFSEASIGNIQATIPEQGFVDHVITPAFGLALMIGEDAMDRYIIRRLEQRTNNRLYRVLLRGGLNPTRSFANVIGGRWPWARNGDESQRFQSTSAGGPSQLRERVEPRRGVPPYEFAFNSYFLKSTNGPCIGGGSTVATRLHAQWQIVGDISGCKMTGLDTNLSGDSMTYVIGLRWTPPFSGRWRPYLQMLGGGSKVTQELMMPELKAALELKARKTGAPVPNHTEYTRQFDTAGFALVAGAGLGYKVNRAIVLRLVSVDYTRAWIRDMPGFAAPNGFQLKAGLVLHIGTW